MSEGYVSVSGSGYSLTSTDDNGFNYSMCCYVIFENEYAIRCQKGTGDLPGRAYIEHKMWKETRRFLILYARFKLYIFML